MTQIAILSVHLQNKIAAGEVIERPASVVKELIENAIDAGSTAIAVEVEKAGRKLIRVADNGTGMDRADAERAFDRYATSKISNESDLFSLHTLGFRGEGLAAIAAAARISLVTARRNVAGTSLSVTGGIVEDLRDCAAVGTSLEVRDLFYNTPARRKFLKSDTTENYHITDTVTRAALAHPSIHFTLRADGGEIMLAPSAASYRERIMQIFGMEFVDGLFETKDESAGLHAHIFISSVSMVRNTRTNQYIFVNNRPVKDLTIQQAIYRAYEGMFSRDQHPVYFVFLTVDAARVDCNVHPTKREVRFQDASSVFRLIADAARRVLLAEAVRYPSGTGHSPEAELHYHIGMKAPLPAVPYTPPPLQPEQRDMVAEAAPEYMPDRLPFVYLGDTFVAFSDKAELIVMDYHAAHERVNYERFLNAVQMPAHQLLFPQQVQLQRHECSALLENKGLLHAWGIEIDDFGDRSIIVRSVPELLQGTDLSSLLHDVAGALLLQSEEPVAAEDGVSAVTEPLVRKKRSLAAQLACHASVRGREAPDAYRLAQLKRSLELTRDPARCPHGRPTQIRMTMETLRKMFKKV
ncbi:MAG TPA: DNA mismatch repair endonuclease MutL [Dissulfurispiraceae bacterium]|nr:DNA mismatch repair endonuclease MutL [Dissulfurispiraceae bacterium]